MFALIKSFVYNNLNDIELKLTVDLREQADLLIKIEFPFLAPLCFFLSFLINDENSSVVIEITLIYSEKNEAEPCFTTLISGHANAMGSDMLAASAHYRPPTNLQAHGWKLNGVPWFQGEKKNYCLWREKDY